MKPKTLNRLTLASGLIVGILVGHAIVLTATTQNRALASTASSSTTPLHVPTWAYVGQFNQNMTATSTEINRNVTYGEDAGAAGNPTGNVTSICSNSPVQPCKSVLYLNANNALIYNGKCGTRSGDSDDFPYGHGNWVSHEQDSWHLHVGDGSSRDTELYGVQGRPCAEGHPVTNYVINQADPGFIKWINDNLQHATFSNGRIVPDHYYALMVDNTLPAQSMFFRNVGEKRNCGKLPEGLSEDSEIKVASSDCSSSREFATDDAYQRMHLLFFNALRHSATGPYHGAPFNVFYNGLKTTDMTILVGSTNVLGGICEYCVVEAGHPASAASIANVLDVASYVNNKTTKALVILSTGSDEIGSQAQLRARRLHRAAIWLAFNGHRTISWANLESRQPVQSPEWPEDFIYPTRPIQSMQAGSSGDHGAVDLIVAGRYPAGIYRREFRECYDGSSGAPILIGSCAVVLNLSAVPQPLSGLTFKYAHHVGFCLGFSSYTDAPGCNPVSSAGDVLGQHGTGPGSLDLSTLSVRPGDLIPPRDAMFLTSR